MVYFLAIETSCDETAAAVFTDEPRVLASVVASQTDLHARFGGVVPGGRGPRPTCSGCCPSSTRRCGRPASRSARHRLHRGASTRRGWSAPCWSASAPPRCWPWPWTCRWSRVNHIEAHIYACRLAAGRDIFPCVGLVVSGGHTSLFHCRSPLDFELLGGTLDDAAGEAFDKVASHPRPGLSRRPGRRTRSRRPATRRRSLSRAPSCTRSGSISASAA